MMFSSTLLTPSLLADTYPFQYRKVNGIHDGDERKKRLQDKFKGRRDGISDRQHEDTVNDCVQRGKECLPEERRDQVIYCGKATCLRNSTRSCRLIFESILHTGRLSVHFCVHHLGKTYNDV
jgi:hypothetical protein